MNILFLVLGFLCIQLNSVAEVVKEPGYEEVVVTATRTSQQFGSLGLSNFVLNREMIEASGKSGVVDLLRSVPGVFVKRIGGLGSQSTISLRGIPYKYTLVMLDGVKLADYMGNGGSGFPVLDHLSSDQIEKIEVVYGPQSTLWGSDAVGGVINVITRKGEGTREAWLSQEIGTHGTFKTGVGIRGESEREDYSLFISKLDSDGFSDASRTNPNLFNGQAEDDGYANLSARLNLGFKHEGGARSRFRVHSIRSKKEYDDGFVPSMDQNSRSETSDLYFGLSHDRPSKNGFFEDHFSFSSAKFDSKNFIDTVSAFGPWAQNTRFIGTVKNLNWQRDFYYGDRILSLGWDFEQNFGSSLADDKLKNNVVAYYIQNQWEIDNFAITAGARRDQHSTYGSSNTFKISPSFTKGDYHFYGSYGTGFKAPTLYEFLSEELMMNWNLMQMVRINNSNLKPAKSRGYSFGVSKKVGNNSNIGIAYFDNDIENNIGWDSDLFRFENLGEIRTRGFEISFQTKINSKLELNSSFTKLRAQEFPTGNQLRREPRHRFRTNLGYQLSDASRIHLNYRQVADQIESYLGAWNPERYTPSFRVLDLGYSLELANKSRLNLRIENLLSSDHEEVFGYANGGRKAYISYTHFF